jgi:hypothetical protein
MMGGKWVGVPLKMERSRIAGEEHEGETGRKNEGVGG